MLIRDALALAISRLTDAGIDSPRLDAELLLAHALKVSRAQVLAWPDRQLTPTQVTQFREMLARRALREPLPYITGYREFFGLDFHTDPRVLIPRPETELLVDEALRLADRLATPVHVADVGTGSGAIAVSLAFHLTEATVYALDASAGALAVAAENAHRHGVSGRVHCLQGDLLEPLPGQVDLIVANLPYVTTEEWQNLAPEIREYEPREALTGGPDGLDLIRRLLATAGPYLKPDGGLLLEIGAGQGTAATNLSRRAFPQGKVRLYQDYAGLDRVVSVRIA